jgi:hypothetical protein
MFGKNKQPPNPERHRPLTTPERRNSAVFSYHAARSARPASGNPSRDLKAQEQAAAHGAAAARRNAHGNWLKRTTTVVGLVLLGLVLLSSLFLGTTPGIMQAGDTRGAIFLRSQAVYEQAAADLLRSMPLNRTKITINSRRIAQELAREFPELGSVTVSLPVFGHQPMVHIEPATPALIMSTTIGGQSYVLDATGRALITPAQAPGVGKLGLPVVTDQSGLLIHAGQVALPSSTTTFITEVVGQLKAAHVAISSLTLPKATSELDVRIEGAPYYVKFNVMGNGRVQAGSFLAVKQQIERDHKTPGTYVDVRVEGRAYYK